MGNASYLLPSVPSPCHSPATATTLCIIYALPAGEARSEETARETNWTCLTAHYVQIRGRAGRKWGVSWGGPLLLPPSCISRACDRCQLQLNSPRCLCLPGPGPAKRMQCKSPMYFHLCVARVEAGTHAEWGTPTRMRRDVITETGSQFVAHLK